jgi:hypothetical protein
MDTNTKNIFRPYFKILLIFTKCLLNMRRPIPLNSVYAADVHLAQGQILREELTVNKGKYLEFRTGTRIQTVSSKEGQYLRLL